MSSHVHLDYSMPFPTDETIKGMGFHGDQVASHWYGNCSVGTRLMVQHSAHWSVGKV